MATEMPQHLTHFNLPPRRLLCAHHLHKMTASTFARQGGLPMLAVGATVSHNSGLDDSAQNETTWAGSNGMGAP